MLVDYGAMFSPMFWVACFSMDGIPLRHSHKPLVSSSIRWKNKAAVCLQFWMEILEVTPKEFGIILVSFLISGPGTFEFLVSLYLGDQTSLGQSKRRI